MSDGAHSASDQGTEAGSQATGQPGAGAGQPQAGSWERGQTAHGWLSALGDADLAANPALNRIADVRTLARSYVEAHQTIAAKGLNVPGKDAQAGEIQFFRELGAGAGPDSYGQPADWQAPAGLAVDPAFISAMSKAAFDAKIPKAAWDKLFLAFVSFQEQELGEQREQLQQQATNQKAMSELTTRGTAGMSQADAERELRLLEVNPVFLKVWYDPEHPEHADAVWLRASLYEAANPAPSSDPGGGASGERPNTAAFGAISRGSSRSGGSSGRVVESHFPRT